MEPRIFLLSPARTTGRRAEQLFRPSASFPMAEQLHAGKSLPLGEVFSFLSGLYFPGKMDLCPKVFAAEEYFVITSNRGLLEASTPISLADLLSFSEGEIDARNEEYRRPLEIDLAGLARRGEGQFILLGSLASHKYVPVLSSFLGGRLFYPRSFPGLGDMARGSLLLRHAVEDREMAYAPAAVTHKKPAVRRFKHADRHNPPCGYGFQNSFPWNRIPEVPYRSAPARENTGKRRDPRIRSRGRNAFCRIPPPAGGRNAREPVSSGNIAWSNGNPKRTGIHFSGEKGKRTAKCKFAKRPAARGEFHNSLEKNHLEVWPRGWHGRGKEGRMGRIKPWWLGLLVIGALSTGVPVKVPRPQVSLSHLSGEARPLRHVSLYTKAAPDPPPAPVFPAGVD